MKLQDFDYHLPPERIAQTPAEPRDSARLMVIHRETGELEHKVFSDILGYIRPQDVLVVNQTRVIPARLAATKKDTGGAAEILLLQRLDETRWRTIVGGQKLTTGTVLVVARDDTTVEATIEEELEEAERIVRFSEPLGDKLDALGIMPLPPYIHRPLDDPERYQTVYARHEGSAAAPTAGLHFTGDLLMAIQRQGTQIAYCTLHIGLDTFAPVKVENIEDHHIHRERAILSAEDARLINEAKLAGGRIIAVGTTSTRTLETAALRSLAFSTQANVPESIMQTLANLPDGICPWRPVVAIDEETDLYIMPGFQYRAVNALITNFHLPKSTLLMMISAFAGRELILRAYTEAVEQNYRFYSLGDATLIL
ncbi:MAG: tRNA preQ1(34) S-adenosylmethionine ribosyltransferase-isomerase QueA [Anaerolineales bacterium]